MTKHEVASALIPGCLPDSVITCERDSQERKAQVMR